MKISIEVCSICHTTTCDGKEYRAVGHYGSDVGIELLDKIVCSSMVYQKPNGRYEYRFSVCTGIWQAVPAFPVDEEATDEIQDDVTVQPQLDSVPAEPVWYGSIDEIAAQVGKRRPDELQCTYCCARKPSTGGECHHCGCGTFA